MTLPDRDLARVRRWVDGRNEELRDVADKIRIEMEVDPRAITILECWPPWDEAVGPEWIRQEVARLRYTRSRQEWTLYWPDRNSKFHTYDQLEPSPNVERLLAEIDADPTCLFWG